MEDICCTRNSEFPAPSLVSKSSLSSFAGGILIAAVGSRRIQSGRNSGSDVTNCGDARTCVLPTAGSGYAG